MTASDLVKQIFSRSDYLAKSLVLIYVVTMVVGIAVYHNANKPKVLLGSDLNLATATFESVKTADYLAEYFPLDGDSSSRDAANFKATEDVKHFRKMAVTKEAIHTVDLLDIYLASAESLHSLDAHCSQLRNRLVPTHPVKDSNGELVQAPEDLAAYYTVPFMVCMSTRRVIEFRVQTCRNEIASYIDGEPISTTIHDKCQSVNERMTIDRKIGLDPRYVR
jgi:hypothetical protein